MLTRLIEVDHFTLYTNIKSLCCTPEITGKFGLGVQNEAGQRPIEFCQENPLVIVNTLFQQHKIRLYTWTSPDGQHQNQIDYILCSQRWRRSIQSAKTRPGADCGSSDHEFLIAKIRLKLNKVGKNTRQFRYNLNQIPYDYTVEVRNRFKGLDLIDRVPDELWNAPSSHLILCRSLLPCLSRLFFPQLFVKSPQPITLPSCLSFSLEWFWSHLLYSVTNLCP